MNPVNLFFACDNAYVPFLAVTLTSLKENCNPKRDYALRILHTGLDPENIRRLTEGFASEGFTMEFIDITQSTKNVVFCGTFTAGGLKTAAENGKLVIVQEGRTAKLVEQVQQITFNGPYAAKCGQHVLYITERAVFELRPEGMTLIKQVLKLVEYKFRRTILIRIDLIQDDIYLLLDLLFGELGMENQIGQ